MYGLIAKLRSMPDQRDALLAILTEGTGSMPGCLAYIVSKDPSDPDVVWIVESWTDKASHDAALSIPSVQSAIARAKPLLAGFETSIPIEPVGGIGLQQPA
jgi:quinol monooxygenase YgiN